MNRKEKVKYEESDTSHAFSQSVLTVRSVARRSRILNSCSNQPNISESKCLIHSDSMYPIVKLGDDVYTEEEEDDNTSLHQSLGDLEVSKESLVISNESKSNASDKYIRVANKDVASLSLQHCTQVPGKQIEYSTNNNEDSMN